MKTYQIDLLNPKAARLLQDLAELNLISIKETKKENFLEIVAKLLITVSFSFLLRH
jgi:hypothetical protein